VPQPRAPFQAHVADLGRASRHTTTLYEKRRRLVSQIQRSAFVRQGFVATVQPRKQDLPRN